MDLPWRLRTDSGSLDRQTCRMRRNLTTGLADLTSLVHADQTVLIAVEAAKQVEGPEKLAGRKEAVSVSIHGLEPCGAGGRTLGKVRLYGSGRSRKGQWAEGAGNEAGLNPNLDARRHLVAS